MALLVAALSIPLSASAGIFDFARLFFSEHITVAQSATSAGPNSQVMDLLRAATNLDPNPAKGGGDITIIDDSALLADAGPEGTMADIEGQAATSHQISLYVVREGDTLSTIARLFNVSVNTVMWANDITRATSIQPGQTLVILPISGVRHTVAKGETLASIAKKYKGDIDEILNYNGLEEGAVLAVGDIVVIPDGEIPAPARSTVTLPLRGGGGPTYSGYYLRPVAGGVRTQGLHGYNGVDLASYAGAQILASAAGTVIIARNSGWNGGYGNYVVISHPNGTQTLYSHLSSGIVSVGQSVVQGQVIGYMGRTGKATGVHLHFEIRGASNPF